MGLRISIRSKLLLSFSALLAVILVGGVYEISSHSSFSNNPADVISSPMGAAKAALQAKAGIISIHLQMKNALANQDFQALEDAARASKAKEEQVFLWLSKAKEKTGGEQAQGLVNRNMALLLLWKQARQTIMEHFKEGRIEEARAVSAGMEKELVTELLANTDLLFELSDQEARALLEKAGSSSFAGNMVVAAAFLTATALGLILAVLVSNHIARRLDVINEAGKKIAIGKFGDLIDVPGADEVSQLADTFNLMSHFLFELNTSLREELKESNLAKDRLLASQSALAMAQKIANLGNWDWEIATGNLEWSDEIYNIFGMDKGKFKPTYEAFIDIVHPDDRQAVVEAVDNTIQRNAPYNIEHRIILADGAEKVVHEQGEVIFGSDGKPKRMIGTVQDITERFEAKKTLAVLIENEMELQREKDELQKALQEQKSLTGWEQGAITATLAGVGPLRTRLPNDFTALQSRYEKLLDDYLEALGFNRTPPRNEINQLSDLIGATGAGPRDVIDIHIRSVVAKSRNANPKRARAYTVEGRLLALEIMGNLVDFYRRGYMSSGKRKETQ